MYWQGEEPKRLPPKLRSHAPMPPINCRSAFHFIDDDMLDGKRLLDKHTGELKDIPDKQSFIQEPQEVYNKYFKYWLVIFILLVVALLQWDRISNQYFGREPLPEIIVEWFDRPRVTDDPDFFRNCTISGNTFVEDRFHPDTTDILFGGYWSMRPTNDTIAMYRDSTRNDTTIYMGVREPYLRIYYNTFLERGKVTKPKLQK